MGRTGGLKQGTFTTRVVIEYVGGAEVSRHLESYVRSHEQGDTEHHSGTQYTRTVVESCDGVEVGRYSETFYRFSGETNSSRPPDDDADNGVRSRRTGATVVNLFDGE